MTKTEERLKKHDLRVTRIRKQIYEYFSAITSAVSQSELESVFNNEFDRVTIYRTLNSFLDKGILHRIPDDSGAAKYALCSTECADGQHIDNHIHFKCSTCGKLFCMYERKIPDVKLPVNFIAKNAILLYEGICSDCN